MSAAALDRRHVQEVELAMELQATAHERMDLDRKDDVVRRSEWVMFCALRDALRPIVESIPGGRRIWTFLAGIAEALRTRDTIEKLDDRLAARELAVATELAGLLDGSDARAVTA